MAGKTVMGVDTSTKSMAFCIYNEDGRPVKWGEVFFGGKTSAERLVSGGQVLRELRTARDEFDVDVLAAEATVFVNNRAVVIAMAHSLGMIISCLGNTDVRRYAPIKWQQAIGNGLLSKAEKAQIAADNPGKSKTWLSNAGRDLRKQRTIDWVYTKYGITIESDNVADAFGVGYMGWLDANSD